MKVVIFCALVIVCTARRAEHHLPVPQEDYHFDFGNAVPGKLTADQILGAPERVMIPLIDGSHAPACGLRKLPSVVTRGTRVECSDGSTVDVSEVNTYEGHFCSGHGRVTVSIDGKGRVTGNYVHKGVEYAFRNGKVVKEKKYKHPSKISTNDDPDRTNQATDSSDQVMLDEDDSDLTDVLGSASSALAGWTTYPKCVTVAIDADFAFVTKFGGATGAANYIAQLMTKVSFIYHRDFGVPLRLGNVVLRTTAASDPHTGTNTATRLTFVRTHWHSNALLKTYLPKNNLVHHLTSKGIGGGRAYIGGVWSNAYQFAVSGSIRGNFHAWDIMVTAHEMGHNFGTHHTHSSAYNPKIDKCGLTGSAKVCTKGTLMSYCHTCPGGMANIKQEFHPRVETAVKGFLNTNKASIKVTPCGYEDCQKHKTVVYYKGLADKYYKLYLQHKTNHYRKLWLYYHYLRYYHLYRCLARNHHNTYKLTGNKKYLGLYYRNHYQAYYYLYLAHSYYHLYGSNPVNHRLAHYHLYRYRALYYYYLGLRYYYIYTVPNTALANWHYYYAHYMYNHGHYYYYRHLSIHYNNKHYNQRAVAFYYRSRYYLYYAYYKRYNNVAYQRVATFNYRVYYAVYYYSAKGLSFRSYNYPTHYIRHAGYLGYISSKNSIPSHLKKDGSWHVEMGFYGTGTIAIRSTNYPTYYLRHSGYRLRISPYSSSTLFKKDATWTPVSSLIGNPSYVSLRSYNYPTRYIRHRYSQLWLDAYSSAALYKKDASFYMTKGIHLWVNAPQSSVQQVLSDSADKQQDDVNTDFDEDDSMPDVDGQESGTTLEKDSVDGGDDDDDDDDDAQTGSDDEMVL